MKLTIAAIGRMRDGAVAQLVQDYLARAGQTGRPVAFGPCRLIEIDERKARDRAQQSARLRDAIPDGAHCIALDERGRAMRSPEFAELLARLRDAGTPETVFLIGGADGHDAALRQRADRVLGFGPMVWPHMLARVMLAEQLYRAASIVAGTPYHRD